MSGYGLRVLRREAANTTTSIQSRCRRAASQDFPDRFAQEYLRGLHDLAELLYKEITALSNDPSLEYQDKRRQARGHLRYLRKISEWVRFADSAHVATTPWSIILPLKKLVHPLIGDCEFLVRSKWRWNYQILRNVVQFVRDDILDHVEIRESHQDLYLKLESFITSWRRHLQNSPNSVPSKPLPLNIFELSQKSTKECCIILSNVVVSNGEHYGSQ
jgi:nicotinamide riboside kinase